MTDLAWDENGVQHTWDATSIGWAETCLQYYSYKIQGWEPLRKSVHLIWGGLIADGLALFYRLIAEGKSHDDALIDVVWEALKNTWEYKLDENGQPTNEGAPVVWDHPSKTRENLIRSLVWYADHYKENSVEVVILPDGKPAVEYSFTLPVTDEITFSGHMDRLVTYSGDYYVMDQKTTGNTIGPHFFKQFNPNTQMSMYTFAGKAIYDLPVKGVIIDGIQVMVGFTRFERGFTHRTSKQLDEWFNDSIYHINEARTAVKTGYFPHRPSSCDKYGGCEFREVCSRSPEVRENFLRADFKQGKRWNPLERR